MIEAIPTDDLPVIVGAILLTIALMIVRDDLKPWLEKSGLCLLALSLIPLLILAGVLVLVLEGLARLPGAPGRVSSVALAMRRKAP